MLPMNITKKKLMYISKGRIRSRKVVSKFD